MTSLERSDWLVSRGLRSHFPIQWPRHGVLPGQPGDGKVPAIAWREFQTKHPTDAQRRAWFLTTEENIAIVTGEINDIVVIDPDEPQALKWCTANLPYTPWQTQTSRGFHLFYRHPGPGIEVRNSARTETRDGRLAIDVRGDGGYVIAPGSIHASGAPYLEAGDWSQPKEAVPRFWVGWLARPSRPSAPAPRTSPPTGDVVERARRYLAAIPVPTIGRGSDAATLYAACRLVRGFQLSEAEATALLWEWCGGRPGWTWGWVEQKVEHAARYGTEAIGALR